MKLFKNMKCKKESYNIRNLPMLLSMSIGSIGQTYREKIRKVKAKPEI